MAAVPVRLVEGCPLSSDDRRFLVADQETSCGRLYGVLGFEAVAGAQVRERGFQDGWTREAPKLSSRWQRNINVP